MCDMVEPYRLRIWCAMVRPALRGGKLVALHTQGSVRLLRSELHPGLFSSGPSGTIPSDQCELGCVFGPDMNDWMLTRSMA